MVQKALIHSPKLVVHLPEQCLLCLTLELVGPCVVLRFRAGMEVFDELLSINVPWNQELPGVRV